MDAIDAIRVGPCALSGTHPAYPQLGHAVACTRCPPPLRTYRDPHRRQMTWGPFTPGKGEERGCDRAVSRRKS
jgi:hypothetical protein